MTNLFTICLCVALLLLVAVAIYLVLAIKRQRSFLHQKRFYSKQSSEIRLNLYTRISRELRTLLNVINDSCRLLGEKEHEKLSDDERRELIGKIHASSNKMLNSVDELKEVSGFNGNVPELSQLEVDLVELIMSYRREILHEAHRGVVVGIHTELGGDCIATLNTPLFRQLVMHLLRVCAQRTTEGHITISYKQENDGLRFLIEDTGGAVSEKYKAIIFHDVDYDSLAIPGDDLSKAISLNICKTIAQRMNGTIEAVYKDDGVVFSFWIPCNIKFES